MPSRTRVQPPIALVARGSWWDGTAEFATGNRAKDEALKRFNRSAVRLRERRIALGASVSQAAKWAGLDRETLSKLENGLAWSDAVTVHQVAYALSFDSDLREQPDTRFGP